MRRFVLLVRILGHLAQGRWHRGTTVVTKPTFPYREPSQWSRELQFVWCEDFIGLLQQFVWCDGMDINPTTCFTTVFCQLFDALFVKSSIYPMIRISKPD